MPSKAKPTKKSKVEVPVPKTSRRPGKRPGTTEAVVELKHQVRPVTVKVVTRLDGSPVLARYLEITNTGRKPAALGSG